MEFKLKENIDPRILEDLGFIWNSYKQNWEHQYDDTKIKFNIGNSELEMPLLLYYLIKLDLVEII